MVGYSRAHVLAREGAGENGCVIRACAYASAACPTLQSHQGVDSKINQHERDTEFEQTGKPIADSNVKEDYGQSGDQERDGMAYAPKASDDEALRSDLRSLTMVETAAR